jgi:hypothetical protein
MAAACGHIMTILLVHSIEKKKKKIMNGWEAKYSRLEL